MPGRIFKQVGKDYRYSINGQEKEIDLNGNITNAEYWEYDSRLGRRWNTDPKSEYSLSPYSTFGNSPIMFTDAFGDTTNYYDKSGNTLGTVNGKNTIGNGSDRYINGAEFSNKSKELNSNRNAAISQVSKSIKNTKALAKEIKMINTQFDNELEDLLNQSSTPIDMNSDVGKLARIGFAEFRGSTSVEQQVGMDITENRVGFKNYGNTLDAVITKPKQYSSLNAADPNNAFYNHPYTVLSKAFKVNNTAWVRGVENAHRILFGTSKGISKGATLYYSPRSMNPPGSLPKWNFTKLTEVNIEGIREDHLRLFIEK